VPSANSEADWQATTCLCSDAGAPVRIGAANADNRLMERCT
jgi:hypothetical protein